MKYKTIRGLYYEGRSLFDAPYSKPLICPHCGIHTDSSITDARDFNYAENEYAYVVNFKCTSCNKSFLGIYVGNRHEVRLETIIPVAEEKPLPDSLQNLSPKGARIHAQACRAELREDYELAMTGFRSALESFIKDYALKIKNAPYNDVVSKSLGKAIETYLEDDALSSADVVRILGNDATHYISEHNDINFDTFKLYYDWVLQYIDLRYQIANPPVRR